VIILIAGELEVEEPSGRQNLSFGSEGQIFRSDGAIKNSLTIINLVQVMAFPNTMWIKIEYFRSCTTIDDSSECGGKY
jgi:hypothetical protein